MSAAPSTLTGLARMGFADLGRASEGLQELSREAGIDLATVLRRFDGRLADPDEALESLIRLARRHGTRLGALLADDEAGVRLVLVAAASRGLVEFLIRAPEAFEVLQGRLDEPPGPEALTRELLAAVGARSEERDAAPIAALEGAAARRALRVAYRRQLLRLTAWDLAQPSGLAAVEPVSAALADLAAAALEAALAVARAEMRRSAPRAVALTRLAVIGMGKAGARELNVVSDVDVIFVAERAEGEGPDDVLPTATRLATAMMRVIDDVDVEPPLWQVDANLRPEGRDGALVRTLDSHVAYYRRWAKGWEFQALLKARPLAGDARLGERYIAAIHPMVWRAAAQPDFVSSVQRMRQRVEQHIAPEETDRHVKLGAGGLRDIEFTVQLLQLVHGRTDPDLHQRGTLPALDALARYGYIGRAESAEFGEDYRMLRLLEHRLQLRRLSRTHLMPTDPVELRALARGSGLAVDADRLVERWNAVRVRVRHLHQRLFYRPLLGAVARLPEEGAQLTSASAEDRLASVGYQDPRSALGHIAALTAGVSRRAAIQRTLLPVLLQWFAEGPAPDQGLLAFRRLSEQLGDTTWFLRMLRDSSEAASRLAAVLSGSRYITDLLDRLPDAVRWLERDEHLLPRSRATLRAETSAVVLRHQERDDAAGVLRTARRREVLRLAFASLLGLITVEELGVALSDVTTALLAGVLRTVRRDEGPWPEFAVIAMGRYGGAELGFGSDADVIVVHRPLAGMTQETAQRQAEYLVAELRRLTEDRRLPLDLDMDLRPEGKNGPVVRSLRAYEAYYERWSVAWESQALLRARGVAGDRQLVLDFEAVADRYRYPEHLEETKIREVRRIKARMETERLPKGADPARHLKLGRGSLSDVEWLVQLTQLRHAAVIPALRTQSTLEALAAAVEADLLDARDAATLREAWLLASRARSATTLFSARTSDLLPVERTQLEGVARILEYPPGSASVLEEDYLRTTRRARAVFEHLFLTD